MAQKAIDLCTTAAVAGDLGVAVDATVERAVSAASRMIANYCGRKFEKSAAVTEYPVGTGRSTLFLSQPPIVSVTSITEFGNLVAAADYELESADQGTVRKKNGGSWPETAEYGGGITPTFDRYRGAQGSEGITAVYVGGFVTPGQNSLATDPFFGQTVTVPEDLQEAAILLSLAIYKRRSIDTNIASESIGDWSITYNNNNNSVIDRGMSMIPPDVAAMLAPYVLLRA